MLEEGTEELENLDVMTSEVVGEMSKEISGEVSDEINNVEVNNEMMSVDMGTIEDYGTDDFENYDAAESSGISSTVVLTIVIIVCVIAGIVLGILAGKRSANK